MWTNVRRAADAGHYTPHRIAGSQGTTFTQSQDGKKETVVKSGRYEEEILKRLSTIEGEQEDEVTYEGESKET